MYYTLVSDGEHPVAEFYVSVLDVVNTNVPKQLYLAMCSFVSDEVHLNNIKCVS